MISSSRIIARARLPLLVLLLLAGGAVPRDAGARAWPKPQGYLSDFASAVDAASRDSIEALAGELDRKTGVELAVVTVPDLGGDEIDPVAVDLFKAWGIGKKGKDEGVLILLARKERRVRIEVGYGLEGILPDGRCGSIIRRVMAPELAQGMTGPGLLHGAQSVVGVIARDRGVTITGALPLPSDEGEGGGLSPRGFFTIALLVAMLLSRLLRSGSSRRGWMGPWWWGGGGPGGYGGMFGGFGGMGGGLGGGFGGGGGGGGFGGFGGGRSGGGGASGGF